MESPLANSVTSWPSATISSVKYETARAAHRVLAVITTRSAGSGGQRGAANAASGVYAACVAQRAMIAERLSVAPEACSFTGRHVRFGNHTVSLEDVVKAGALTGEDSIALGNLDKQYQLPTVCTRFGTVGVAAFTGEDHRRVGENGRQASGVGNSDHNRS